jgi:hypothetical protein
VRHLRRQLVERERGDEAEDALRDALGHRDEVWVCERVERREAVHPSGDGHHDAGVSHRVERLPVDAEPQRFGHAEAAAMLAEQLDFTLEHPGRHGDILPSNVDSVKWFCLRSECADANTSSTTGSWSARCQLGENGLEACARAETLDHSVAHLGRLLVEERLEALLVRGARLESELHRVAPQANEGGEGMLPVS